MTDVMPGGRRRLDRILGEDYLLSLDEISLPKVRAKIHYVNAEEHELAFLLVLLRDRIANIATEQCLRGGTSNGPFAHPAAALETRWGGLGRQLSKRHLRRPLLPPRNRRRVERLLHDVDLTDIHNRTDDELSRVLKTFTKEEQHVRDVHDRVRAVAHRCMTELAYRVQGSSHLPRIK
ncbi:MAG: hypothetical protein HOQ05_02120 [Corynebacteriales bacterium]|nr:hypothetical protein [Mycobacteriales bacterium]